MNRTSSNPIPPADAEAHRRVSGAVANLGLKGKQKALTDLLLTSATRTPAMVPEDDLLAKLYGGRGVNESNRRSLCDLVRKVNNKLTALPVQGLKVACETVCHGRRKALWMNISPTPFQRPLRGDRNTPLGTLSSDAPQFTWRGPGIKARSLELWVPVHGPDTELSFRIESEPWTAPQGFTGYAQHREECWRRYQLIRPKASNLRFWHVSEFVQRKDRHGNENHAIEFAIAPVYFWDVVATTWEMDTVVSTDNGRRSIHDWLVSSPGLEGSACRHFAPAANPLMVEVNVITRDGMFIVREQQDRTGKPRWEAAIFGYLDSIQDVYRNAVHLPDPSETVFRKSCHNLGLAINPARICWLGVGFGLIEGKVSLFGEVDIELTADELLSRGRELLSRGREMGNLGSIPATPRSVDDFREQKGIRRHFEALLALSLRRRNRKVNIVNTVAKHVFIGKRSGREDGRGGANGSGNI